ncbi:sacsin N-terminal ATP-binding-like domain-containing protein [Spirosoma fluviale]|uniref:Protein NO VEIN C-terminal domain-containing protein n=1 Tax=Spirosoma fluviale TaxID=1597977 RepID=A0A286GJH5_9BACT|nr:DUF3883 domain-containing protein [Spirosoma fluviale]SOD95683.1 protein of unknown function [Spirosoma fluviale]
MNELKNEIDDFEKRERFSGPAKRIMEKIKPLRSHIDIAKRRWFWELLQNASDVSEQTEIEVVLSVDNLKFRHNGNPFTYKDARNLIEPDSGKDEFSENIPREQIGQFGTGFLATHILSLLIKVDGIIESKDKNNYYKFGFDLDRRYPEEIDYKSALMVSIEKSIEQLNEDYSPITNYQKNGKPETEFNYDFKFPYEDENSFEIAKSGIENLKTVFPFVLSFIPKIKTATIIDRTTSIDHITVYSAQQDQNTALPYQLFSITRTLDGIKETDTDIALISEGSTTVAINVEKINATEISILPYDKELPKLFCAFPFVGTEDFNFPIVINSKDFDPKTERNGIELSDKDDKNRSRIIEAVTAYKKVLKIAETEKWKNIYRICKIYDSNFAEDKIKTWFKRTVVDEIRSAILSHKIVETDKEPIYLKDSLIPYFADKKEEVVKKIYDSSKDLLASKLPKSEHYLEWCNLLDFTYFKDQKLDIEKLVKEIAVKSKLTTLKTSLPPFINVNDWLNTVIELIIETDNTTLLDKFPIIPNQNENFKIRNGKEKLFLDNDVPDELKTILTGLTKNDWKDFLLHKDYERNTTLIADKDKKSLLDIVVEIDNELRDYRSNRKESKFLTAVNSIFKWVNDNDIVEEKAKIYFPWFSQNKAQIVLDTFSTDQDRENAFAIVQSGKMEVLAKIAKSNLSSSDIELVTENIGEFKIFLDWIKNKVDDEYFADELGGNEGESFIYSLLVSKFQKDNVVWASKNAEARFDFQVLNEDKTTRFYIDVKTTSSGIANTDSIPFFMRLSQWNFLDENESKDKYYIARVFRHNEEFSAKFLKINKENI